MLYDDTLARRHLEPAGYAILQRLRYAEVGEQNNATLHKLIEDSYRLIIELLEEINRCK